MKKIIFLLVGVMLISGCSYKNIGFGNSKKTSVCPVVNCGRTESLYKSDRVTDGNGKMKFVEECCTFIAYTGEVVVEGEFLYAFKTDSRLEYEQTPNLYFYPNSSAKYPLDWKPSFIHEGGPIESVAPIRSTFKIDNIDEAVQKFGLSDGVKKLGSKGGSITGNAIIKISGFNLNTSESFGSDSTKLVEVIEKSNVVVKNLETTPSKIINWCDDKKTAANELWISSENFSGMNHAPSIRHVCRGDKELFYLQMNWDDSSEEHAGYLTSKKSAISLQILSKNKDPELLLSSQQDKDGVRFAVDKKEFVYDESAGTFKYTTRKLY